MLCGTATTTGCNAMDSCPLVVALFATAADNTSIFAPVSPSSSSIRDLSLLVFGVAWLIFVIVEGVLFYCLYRFPKREGTRAEPPQVYGSKPIEVAWTVAPTLIVFGLMLVTT